MSTRPRKPKRRAPPRPARATPSKAPVDKGPSTALARRSPEQIMRPTGKTRLEQDLQKAFELAKQAQATNTQRAYRADREHWTAYAKDCQIAVFPITPQHMAAYIQSMNEQNFALSTIRRRCASLSKWHRERAKPNPMNDAVHEILRGLARVRRSKSTKKIALTGDIVGRALVAPSMRPRDRAILAFGYSTGMRRSEIAAVTWADLTEVGDAFVVRIPFSKTDEEGRGQVVALRSHPDPDLCPVRLLRQWRKQRAPVLPADRVFAVCDRTIAEIMKRAAMLSGKDPKLYGGHSSRSGMITSAAMDAAVPIAMVQKGARHARGDQTLDYIDGQIVLSNPAFEASVRSIRRPPSAGEQQVLASSSSSKRAKPRRGGPARRPKRSKA